MTPLQPLLIDDNPDDRLLVLRELDREFSDIRAREITDTKSFNQALEQGGFNLVITDYQLCWSNGLEVLRAIKDRYPRCPIIMFTGTGSEEIAVQAMKLGLDDYVIKASNHYIRLASAARLVWERSQQRLALEESEKRYRRLFEGVPMGLYRVATDSRFLDANQALVQMLGYDSKAELLDLARFDRHLSAEALHRWQTELENQGVVKDLETQLQRHDTTWIWVRHNARAIADTYTQDQFLYYEGAIEDISDRKQAEAERKQLLSSEREARATAEAANRIKDEFLATLSHELRTPLNAMLGWMQLLRGGDLNDTQTQRALEIIERNAKAQAQLIEDLLDVSRIIRGKIELAARPVSLSRVIKAAWDTVYLAAEAKQLRIFTTYEDDSAQVYGDPERLQQVVWNLLVNAVKFTPEGGSIVVKVRANDESVILSVSDTGMGIDPSVVPHLFERFRQAEGSTRRKHGGLGLGLAIVRHLVELHGGTIAAASEGKNQGSTFTLTLPLVKDTAIANSEDSPTSAILLPSHILARVKILLVEDNEDTREFIALMLEEYGAIAIQATSVKEALAAYAETPPDILVSDIGMPEANGYDLVRELRRRSTNDALPIPAIALTAYARPEDIQQALNAGFDVHLPKPIDPNRLVETIAQLIAQQNPSNT
jgi:PAS domain S-box-containing protein